MEKHSTAIPIKAYAALLGDYLRPQKWRAALLAALLLGTIGLQLLNPLVVGHFLDAAEAHSSLDQLFGAALLFMGLAILRELIYLAATYLGENVAWTATNALRADVALHCLRLDMSFHKRYKPGELIERVDGDVNQLANFFSSLVVLFAGNLLLVVGVLAVFWWRDWRLGLGITCAAAAGLAAMGRLSIRTGPRWHAVREAEARLFGAIEEWLNGTEEIRSSGAVPYIMVRLFQALRERYRTIVSAWRLQAWLFVIPNGVFALAYIAAHIVGYVSFQAGAMTIGQVYVIFYYIAILQGPLWEIQHQVEDLQRATASINRIGELRALRPALHDGPGALFGRGPLAVAFEKVTFRYEDDPNTSILEDITFALKPGRVLGLLGRTGSGKSTLSRLLFRFYDPSEGAIRLGGNGVAPADIRQATQAELRRAIGMVTQEVHLFHATVRQNLTLFDDSVPDERIRRVVVDVGLADWLSSLPQGLDTELEGSGGLSAGEAQLLAFARVFLADPGLVILDEASSRLDPATEQRVERAVTRLLDGRTGIIIAHRLATVQRADEIMILQDGRIAEHGPRAALAADPASGFYRLLQTGREEVMA